MCSLSPLALLSTEGVIALFAAIVLVVFPMTWQMQIICGVILGWILVDLLYRRTAKVIHSAIARRFLSIASIVVLAVLLCGPIKEKYNQKSSTPSPVESEKVNPPIANDEHCTSRYQSTNGYFEGNGTVFGPGTCGTDTGTIAKNNIVVFGAPPQTDNPCFAAIAGIFNLELDDVRIVDSPCALRGR